MKVKREVDGEAIVVKVKRKYLGRLFLQVWRFEALRRGSTGCAYERCDEPDAVEITYPSGASMRFCAKHYREVSSPRMGAARYYPTLEELRELLGWSSPA